MNTKDKNISNAASDRHTYLSPRTEIIKIGTINFIAVSETLKIPRKEEPTDEAYGKKWQGDFDLSDEEVGNYEKEEWGSMW
ncbi:MULTISPECIES: hypothetical protein [Prevotellaceae]|uniref:hypothetical protein n=1 Tax=Prevotellaceae TaxID=171552 RepID=UPI0003B7FD28|nr:MULTISPECIES: hypothetical protein [Prevotellaceae]ERT61121.1 hypothetical protein HMPREF1254_2287 [Prevotella sp. BV3P1]